MMKRGFDVLVSLSALIILSPVFCIVALLIAFKLGRPVIFTQSRPGLNGDVFRMYKFRSMTEQRDRCGQLLPDDKRLTAFGKWLRASSLDELPELFNILKGDMSLVGPRPLLIEYLPLYSTEQAKRHLVKPGLTGWAQINGRNAISWQQKFEYDVWYVENNNFYLDVKILFITFIKVFQRSGISNESHATMSKFKGNE